MKLIYQKEMIYAKQLIICESTFHSDYLLHINTWLVTANNVSIGLILLTSKISINEKTDGTSERINYTL